MSNPHVKISSFESSGHVVLENVSWAVNAFSNEKFYTYETGENAKKLKVENFTPPFNMARPLAGESNDDEAAPDFIARDVWNDTYKTSPSCFVTANNSVMPKMISPSVKCTGNGYSGVGGKPFAAIADSNFVWTKVDKETNVDGPDENVYGVSVSDLFLYCTASAVRDGSWNGTVTLKLDDKNAKWKSNVATSSGVVNAFSLLVAITPVVNGAAGADGKGGTSNSGYDPSSGNDPKWLFQISFGDVVAKMSNVSSLNVKIANGSGHDTNVNLASAKAAEGTPQANAMGKNVMQLTFYRCWNGVIVSTGVQNTKEVVSTASTICLKYRDYSLKQYLDAEFDKDDADDVEIPTESGDINYMVDFGDSIKLSMQNCKVNFMYSPVFFAKNCVFDNWQMLNKSNDAASYEYSLYSVYCLNKSTYSFKNSGLNESSYRDSKTGLDWQYVRYSLTSNLYERIPAEIFGYYIKSVEQEETGLKNSNGKFSFGVNGGRGQGPGGSWTDYITHISVSTSVDGGSSGSITVDGTGFSGKSNITQSIGGIQIRAEGGNHTVSGIIFKGIALGISMNASSGNIEYGVNLVGVERKLEDIALINPPFIDGWTLNKACNYLFGYAGINYEIRGDGGLKMPSSTDIGRAVFDWKSGTSVEQALSDVMINSHHKYVVVDGKAIVYELGKNGFPTMLGPNRESGYSELNTVTYDQEPDFTDLRNYLVAMGITQADGGAGTQIESIPFRPTIVIKEQSTTPNVPWARVWALARPGYSNVGGGDNGLSEFAENMALDSKNYILHGKTTIEGNADIKLYDRWGEYIIESVSHDIDMQSKTWTTSLELQVASTGSSGGGSGGG